MHSGVTKALISKRYLIGGCKGKVPLLVEHKFVLLFAYNSKDIFKYLSRPILLKFICIMPDLD